MLAAGIDIGSLSTDAVLINEKKEIVSSVVIPTGASSKDAAEKAFQEAMNKLKVQASDIDYTVSTGYGRAIVPFADHQVTEITCHARGINHIRDSVRTLIDIGGQDSKVIKAE